MVKFIFANKPSEEPSWLEHWPRSAVLDLEQARDAFARGGMAPAYDRAMLDAHLLDAVNGGLIRALEGNRFARTASTAMAMRGPRPPEPPAAEEPGEPGAVTVHIDPRTVTRVVQVSTVDGEVVDIAVSYDIPGYSGPRDGYEAFVEANRTPARRA